MSYVPCGECGYTAVRGPLSLATTCPRCRLRGRAVRLEETQRTPLRVITPDGSQRGKAATEGRIGMPA